jgi:enoyl-CoA hydratase/carnithine racemase
MDLVHVSIVDRVGRIHLERADRRNALTPAMLSAIAEGCRELTGAGVDVVVVSSAGGDFSVGYDLDGFLGGDAADGATSGADAVAAILDLAAVSVARVPGWVVGGGAALAAACDLRVGDATTTVRIPEVPLGIPLGWGAMPLLVAELGPSLTKDLVMTGRDMHAEEAHQRGFLTRLAGPEGVDTALDGLVGRLLAVPVGPLRATKEQVAAVAGPARTGDADAIRLRAAVEDPAFAEAFARYLATVRR